MGLCCPKTRQKTDDPFELAEYEHESDAAQYHNIQGLYPSDEEYYREMNAFEEKLLLKDIPFEEYVMCLFRVMGKDLSTEQERKVPSFNTHEETYTSQFGKESVKAFADELLKNYLKNDKIRHKITHNSIIIMSETISEHIKNKGVDRLVVLHMLSIGLLYCKGGNKKKLKFFYELFKIEKDVNITCLHCDSYSIDMFIFSILIVATFGNFEAQKKSGKMKQSMEDDLRNKFCQIHAINGFEKHVFASMLGITDVNKVANDYEITWQKLSDRYVNGDIKFWPFSAPCIRNYISERIDKL